MPTEDEQIEHRQCPHCRKKLKIPARMLGKRVACPACGQTVDLRSPWDVDPLSTDDVSKSEPVPSPTPVSHLDLDDFGFQLEAPVPVKSRIDDEAMQAKRELDLNSHRSQEFRFSCKVCGSSLYAQPSDVGTVTRCPDCYSEFTVPSPPKKPPSQGRLSEDGPMNPILAPSIPPRAATREAGRSSVEEYLARAAEELANEDHSKREVTYDFDHRGWLRQIFSFLSDPALLVIGLSTGAMFGGVTILIPMIGRIAESINEGAGPFGTMLGLLLFGAPLLAATLANGVAILESSANNLRRIARWPIFSPTESLSETFVVVVALALAATPGGLISWGISWLQGESALGIAFVLLSAGFLFPVILLSMLDNQSITQPISSDVLRSMPERSDAWGAMYLLSALALSAMFLLYLVSRSRGAGALFFFGMSLPFLIYFIFHQYGILASRIADIADLNIDNDDNAESAEQTPVSP